MRGLNSTTLPNPKFSVPFLHYLYLSKSLFSISLVVYALAFHKYHVALIISPFIREKISTITGWVSTWHSRSESTTNSPKEITENSSVLKIYCQYSGITRNESNFKIATIIKNIKTQWHMPCLWQTLVQSLTLHMIPWTSPKMLWLELRASSKQTQSTSGSGLKSRRKNIYQKTEVRG